MNSLNEQSERFDSDSVPRHVFWDENRKLTSILESDLFEIAYHLKINDSQVWRRVYCRTFFSYLDGQVFSLRSTFLFYDWFVLTEDAELKIRNQKIITRKDGTVRVINSHLTLIENIKRVFKAFAIAADVDPIIADDDECWKKLSRANKIRNRITHPKKSDDLTINDTEMALIMEVGEWYLFNAALLLEKRIEAYQRMIQAMRKGANKRFSKKKGDVKE
jgi:hypothetical protein